MNTLISFTGCLHNRGNNDFRKKAKCSYLSRLNEDDICICMTDWLTDWHHTLALLELLLSQLKSKVQSKTGVNDRKQFIEDDLEVSQHWGKTGKTQLNFMHHFWNRKSWILDILLISLIGIKSHLVLQSCNFVKWSAGRTVNQTLELYTTTTTNINIKYRKKK